MRMGLKSGLEWFIAKVEELHVNTTFKMNLYPDCVIGKTYGWKKHSQSEILRIRFGITVPEDRSVSYFSSGNRYFTERQWKVISLFTAINGTRLSRDQWLTMAKETLKTL